MKQYEYLVKQKTKKIQLSTLKKINSKNLVKIKKLYPGIPNDFVNFLREIGAGAIGPGAYSIYSGLMHPDEIFDKNDTDLIAGILFFGDDMKGYSCGFDTNNNWSIVEVDSTDMSMEYLFDNFSDFIQDKLKCI